MKQIVLNVPEKKYEFFVELLKSLDFVKVKGEAVLISEEEKNLVRRRVKNTRPNDIKEWDKVSETFKLG